MLRRWPLFLSFLLIQLAFAFSVGATTLWPKQAPVRIISLSPHITETLFAVGAGKQIIAVTDYCDYPSAAIALPKIGGFINPNLEAIVALEADLVILLASQQQTIRQLNQLGIDTLAVSNRTLADIQSTIETVGHATGHRQAAQQLLKQMADRIAFIREAVAEQTPPRVMIAISHHLGDNVIDTVYIAGQQDFYNDLLQIAGGENAYQRAYPKVPSLSLEGILSLNPNVIIDLFPDADDHSASLSDIQSQWMALTSVNAVQNHQVHLIEADYATIPGPRVILLLEQFARLIHPTLVWPEGRIP
jgi:iron complex transport system substrate-binding protein